MNTLFRKHWFAAIKEQRIVDPDDDTMAALLSQPDAGREEGMEQEDSDYLFLDGDIPQINALFTPAMLADMETDLIEIIKFAAACSALQQPNDLSPCFRALKKKLRSFKYKYGDVLDAAKPRYMKTLAKFLLKCTTLSPAKRDILLKFFASAPSMLESALTPAHIRAGFVKSGVAPFTTQGILQQSKVYSELSDEVKRALYEGLGNLISIVALEGRTAEKDLVDNHIPRSGSKKDTSGQAPALTKLEQEAAERDARVKKRKPLPVDNLIESRQRALWITHLRTIARRREAEHLRAEAVADALVKRKGKKTKEQRAADKLVKDENKCRKCGAHFEDQDAGQAWSACAAEDMEGNPIHEWWYCAACTSNAVTHSTTCQKKYDKEQEDAAELEEAAVLAVAQEVEQEAEEEQDGMDVMEDSA
jgi:ferredoxin